MNAAELTYPRPPQRCQWENLREFKRSKPRHPTVELDEFLSFWEVSNSDLAEVCECSISTVERWFLDKNSPNYREPTERHKHMLAEAHYLWYLETNYQRIIKLKQIYHQKGKS